MKRKTHRDPYRKHPLDTLTDLVKAILGFGPRTGDAIERTCQDIHQEAMLSFTLALLGALGLFCLAASFWDLIVAALDEGPLGRILHASRATRRRLSRQRKVSTHAVPTPEALAAAWAKSRKSLEWRLRLGSMLEDLEPVVDQSYIRDEDGTIVGREPGIRGWLFDHCQVVSEHYKTAMGYKALAHRFRLAIGLPEPFTLEDVLDALSESIESVEDKEKANRHIGQAKFQDSVINAAVGRTAVAADIGAEPVKATTAPRVGAADGEAKNEPQKRSEIIIQNELVENAKQKAETILQNLRIRNRKDRVAKGGRVIWRATWVLDELLHDRLKLLRVPRSA